MPRMQIYLPDDLYAEVKSRKLPASELLQEAIRAEIDREDKMMAMARFVEDSIREHGEPSDEDVVWAEELAGRISSHLQPPVAEKIADSDQHAPKAS